MCTYCAKEIGGVNDLYGFAKKDTTILENEGSKGSTLSISLLNNTSREFQCYFVRDVKWCIIPVGKRIWITLIVLLSDDPMYNYEILETVITKSCVHRTSKECCRHETNYRFSLVLLIDNYHVHKRIIFAMKNDVRHLKAPQNNLSLEQLVNPII